MTLSPFAQSIYLQKYSRDGREEWPDTAARVAQSVMSALEYGPADEETRRVERYILERKFLPGGRYLYAAGRPLHQVCNCLLMRVGDSREEWGDLWRKAGMALLTGAGIGVEYSQVRSEGTPISRTGGRASGPCSLMQTVNEIGRQVMQGGSRRSAIWAGLSWKHPDVFKFMAIKEMPDEIRRIKLVDPAFPARMELTNISVGLDDEFFDAFGDPCHPLHGLAVEVYREASRRMARDGEPGFSVNVGRDSGEDLRNACTEITSADSDDICNLGSLNLARIESLEELRDVIDAATLFLLAGSVYTDLPYVEVGAVRDQNRRLGLGAMGIHEWLLLRDKPYGPDAELGAWLSEYAKSTDVAAGWADKHSLSRPVKTRAIAPTGTIGIIGETTTGIEPIYCVAYRRRYVSGKSWRHQYVVDPTARRIVDEGGIDPSSIEDSIKLSYDPGRRIAMQRWVQQFVDHGISSTVNLPEPLDPDAADRLGDTLMQHLRHLRGITLYPSGARGLDPLEAVPYEQAITWEGVVFEESEERCVGGACGV